MSGFVGEAPFLLAKPQTYMNLSGESVSGYHSLKCTSYSRGLLLNYRDAICNIQQYIIFFSFFLFFGKICYTSH